MRTCPVNIPAPCLAGVVALATLAANSILNADTVNVPGDYPTIQEAIDVCINGDEVHVAAGVYNETIDYGNRGIKVIGVDGPDVTVLDANGSDLSIVNLTGQLPTYTLLKGFTIRNANGGTPVGQDPVSIIGGGVCIMGGGPVIEDCIFLNNHSGYGGAIHSDGTTSVIRNCEFRGNSASANAGAILAINGSVQMENCLFDDNSATLWGGALHIVKGTPTLTNCTITNNESIHGGGLYWHQIDGGASLPITGCIITDNYAKNDGGGIRSLPARPPVVFTDSTLCDNAPEQIVGPFIDNGGNALCVCPADINGTGAVDVTDILVIIAQWGTAGPQGDVNQDGIVNVQDLLIAIDEFGPCVEP